MSTPRRSSPVGKDSLHGYSVGRSSHKLDKDGTVTIRIAPLDPGLLMSAIKIY